MKSYDDISGDGGSRVVEQVTAQQARLARSLAGVRHRVAVGSGKGGVGKSTLTRLLACALGAAGQRVAILDADLNGPSQARLAGLDSAPLVPGAEGLVLPRSADGIGVLTLGAVVPDSESVELDGAAGSESHVWRATREFAFLRQLIGSVAWGELDFLLFDLPPGAERTYQFADFLGSETDFVLVTLPSELSRSVVSRSIAALAPLPNRLLGYVENMQGYYCSDCDEVRPLFPAGQAVELALECLGSVPFDPRLAAAGEDGLSAARWPESPATRAVRGIAARLVEALEDDR